MGHYQNFEKMDAIQTSAWLLCSWLFWQIICCTSHTGCGTSIRKQLLDDDDVNMDDDDDDDDGYGDDHWVWQMARNGIFWLPHTFIFRKLRGLFFNFCFEEKKKKKVLGNK